MHLAQFDPLTAEWFEKRFGAPTEPQIAGWREISKGSDVLISAPTGSGKTLAAFLICLDRLVRAARTGFLPDETQVVYVSPLKALSNDVRSNLEIAARPDSRACRTPRFASLTDPHCRPHRRYADALNASRCARKPPHILVTTPESLFILLTAEKPRADAAHHAHGDRRRNPRHC